MDTTKILLKLSPRFIRRKLEHRQELRKILDNINWLSAEKVLKMGLGIIVSALVARYLGPEKFGMMNFAVSFVGLFVAFNKLGLDNIVVRNIVRNPEKSDKYLGSALVLRLLGSLLLLLFAVIGIKILRPESTLMLVFVVIVSLMHLFKSFQTIDLWFRSQVRSKYTVYSRTIAFVVISGLKLLFILTQQPLIAFVMMFAQDGLIAAIFLITFYQMRGEFSILKWKARFGTMKELLRDSWPLILSGVAVAIHMHIDKVMLGSMLSDSAVGIYSAAAKIVLPLSFVAMAIINSTFPHIIDAKKKSQRLYMHRFQNLFDILVWMAIGMGIFFTVLSGPIIHLLYGVEYALASIVLAILIWAKVFNFYGTATSKFVIAENLTKISFYRTFIGASVNIILNLILIPILGVVGSALATLLSVFIQGFLSVTFFNKTRHLFPMFFKSFNIPRLIKELKGVF